MIGCQVQLSQQRIEASIPISDLGQQRTGIVSEWVEEESIAKKKQILL